MVDDVLKLIVVHYGLNCIFYCFGKCYIQSCNVFILFMSFCLSSHLILNFSYYSAVTEALIVKFLKTLTEIMVRSVCPYGICVHVYPCVSYHAFYPGHWVILWPEQLIIVPYLWCYFQPRGPVKLSMCMFGVGNRLKMPLVLPLFPTGQLGWVKTAYLDTNIISWKRIYFGSYSCFHKKLDSNTKLIQLIFFGF